MEKEFINWFKVNEKRFTDGQFDEKQIAYSAWLEGKKQTKLSDEHDQKTAKIKNIEMKDISHNLKVAEPHFIYFIKNINKELSQWIQYNGVDIDGSEIFFKFKSSQNSLNFKIYGGANTNNIYHLLNAKSTYIYDFFKKLKYENL